MLSRGSPAEVMTEPLATAPPISVLLSVNRADPARSTAAETRFASAVAGTTAPLLVEIGGACVAVAVAALGVPCEHAPRSTRTTTAATTRGTTQGAYGGNVTRGTVRPATSAVRRSTCV